ncbi:MAG: twin-arginine translocase subunit TatC [Deltaproteobacteria bacterium]|nr:twin-arginine translocase subunit TatC [Deltaproteobacteria bacterium]MBI3294527.1 twin-arginine translocase subunit TatC [Deltaproteobacteria bacterium]
MDDEKPLWQHLDDLRKCLVRSLLAMVVTGGATFSYIDEVMEFLEEPLLKSLPPERMRLYFTGITDKFMTYFTVGVLISFCAALPYILYQVWIFVSPGLYRHEKKFVFPFVFFSFLSFAAGVAFAYYVILPAGFDFLIHFGGDRDQPLITLTEYFSFTLKMLFAIGAIFEMPVVLVILGKLGIVTAEFLSQYRRHAFLVISVIAAIVTPTPDALTMCMVMGPMYVLYEISIIGVRIVGGKK